MASLRAVMELQTKYRMWVVRESRVSIMHWCYTCKSIRVTILTALQIDIPTIHPLYKLKWAWIIAITVVMIRLNHHRHYHYGDSIVIFSAIITITISTKTLKNRCSSLPFRSLVSLDTYSFSPLWFMSDVHKTTQKARRSSAKTRIFGNVSWALCVTQFDFVLNKVLTMISIAVCNLPDTKKGTQRVSFDSMGVHSTTASWIQFWFS